MKKTFTQVLILILSAFVLSGCGKGQTEVPDPAAQANPARFTLQDHIIPISIDGMEIQVGITSLQTLLDHEIQVLMPVIQQGEIRQQPLNPEAVLAANSKYEDAFFWIGEGIFVRLTLMAGPENTPMKEATLSRLELHCSNNADVLPDNVLVNGASVRGMDRADAMQAFPDFQEKDSVLTQRGADYRCTLRFSTKTQTLSRFSLRHIGPDDEDVEDYKYSDPWKVVWPDEEE